MNRQTEDRLRAAFDAKAEQVTDERLARLTAERRQLLIEDVDGSENFPAIPGFTDHQPARPGAAVTRLDIDHPAGSPRHARWLAPVLAAAAVLAVAVGVTAISTSVDNGKRTPLPPASQVSTPAPSLSPTPSSTPSGQPTSNGRPTGATSPAQAVLLGNGKQADRSQIPWDRVGPGWHLASAAPGGAGKVAVYLINPIGGRYLITDQLPHAKDSVGAWSPDGKRAMLSRDEDEDRILTELELATGRVLHTFAIGKRGFQGYTRPNGQAILVVRSADAVLERLGADGSHQLTYPGTLPGFGKIGFPSLYNATGAELLVGGEHGIALLGNDGHLIRVLPAPAGAKTCWPAKWWDSSTVLETCNFSDGVQYTLFLQPVAGGQPVKLAGASTTHPLGFANAWRYSEGILLSGGAGCGPGRLEILRDGVIRPLRLPAGVQDSPPVIGVAGDVLTMRQLGGCPASDKESVVSMNLVTGATTTVFQGTARLIPYPWQ